MSNEKPTLSIIVPVYNVEPYLQECVDSILGQTFEDFECILVDDGSTDGCPAICDSYAESDPRVRVIHKANGGLSDARNAGIDAARADILSFVDSDDVIHSQMMEALVSPLLEDGEVDASVCPYERFASVEELDDRDRVSLKATVIPAVEALEIIYSAHPANLGFVAWNKAYRRSLFDETGARYPVGRIHEDDFTTYKLLYVAREVALIDVPLYFYRTREGSIMARRGQVSERSLDAIDARREAYEFFKGKERALAVASMKSLLRSCMQIWAVATPEGFGATARKVAMDTYRKTWDESAHLLDAEPKKKLAYGLFPRTPRLACRLFGEGR